MQLYIYITCSVLISVLGGTYILKSKKRGSKDHIGNINSIQFPFA